MNENQNEYVDINVHDNYPDSDQTVEIPTMKVIPLKKICMTIGELPSSYLETMTYYEMLVWFIEYLKNNIIPTVNNNGEAVEELQTVVMELQNYINEFKDSIDEDVEGLEDYINNYFENLDVQEEINNKLDQMLEDGVLEQIIEQYIQSSALWCFDNVADMKLATNFVNGSYAKTLGYYSKNDGGESIYKIRTKTNDDIPDEKLIISLYNNTLVAEIIAYDTINIKQLGAYGDGIHDELNSFKAFTNSSIKKLIIPNGTYNLSDMITFTNKELIGIGQPTIEYVSQTTSGEHYIKFYNYFKVENITFNQKVHGTDVVGVFDCSYSQFKNCKFIADGYNCGSELDLYTNNHDILIDNCYFKLKSYDASNVIQEGGIWVREHISDKETYNITFNNCVISHDSKDEIIAVWNWIGSVHHVQLNNCKLIGEENNTAPWFITFNINHSSINNCYIENKRPTTFSGMFKQNENIDYDDVSVNNCSIIQKAGMLNGFSTFKLTFNNCYIKNTDTVESIGLKSTFNNCFFDLLEFAINCGTFNGCHFKGDGTTLGDRNNIVINYETNPNLYILNCIFENFKLGTGMFIYVFNDCNDIIIKDTIFDIDISSKTYWLFGNKTITNFQVINSNIERGIYYTGTTTGVIANNITNRTISSFSNVKVNNNFDITA